MLPATTSARRRSPPQSNKNNVGLGDVPDAVSGRRHHRPAVLRVRSALTAGRAAVVPGRPQLDAAELLLGHPHRRNDSAEHARLRLLSNTNRTHDVDGQPDEDRGPPHRQGRASTTSTAASRRRPGRRGTRRTTATVNFGNDTQQPARHDVRLRERGARDSSARTASSRGTSRAGTATTTRVLPAGQLEGELQADARLRPAFRAPAAAVRRATAWRRKFFPNEWIGSRRRALPAGVRAGAVAPCTVQQPARAESGDRPDARAGSSTAGRQPRAGRRQRHERHLPRGRRRHPEGRTTSGRRWSARRAFGAAYDLSGNQRLVIRGGGGIFYDRPDGNPIFGQSATRPVQTITVTNSTLQDSPTTRCCSSRPRR